MNSGYLLRMLWAFQGRIVRYLKELFIKEGTYGLDDDDEFFHWRRGLFDFEDRFFYRDQDILDIKVFE